MLLSLETSSPIASIALSRDGDLLAVREFSHGLQNAARLLPLVDQMLHEHSLKPAQITDIAVSIGPGSFTGLRIGLTLAKTLAFATGARLIAVPSLPAIALNAPDDAGLIMPILDAKRDQVFAGIYNRRGHHLDEILAPTLTNLPELLTRAPRPLTILGQGLQSHARHIPPDSPDLHPLPESYWYPKAQTVANLALRLIQQGAFADPYRLTPLYIRKPEAQERMEAGLLKHLEM